MKRHVHLSLDLDLDTDAWRDVFGELDATADDVADYLVELVSISRAANGGALELTHAAVLR